MCGVPDQAEPDLLRRFLAERDVACPRCGYNLRGLASDRCPECAWKLMLGANPPWSHCVPALFGLGLGAAPWCLFGALALSNTPAGMIIDVPSILPGVAIAVLCVVFWRIARAPGRWWLYQARPWGRRFIALGCWALSPAMVIVYFLVISRLT